MKRKRKAKTRIRTRTLGDLKVRRKVEVKPHSRKTRSGKTVVVKGYERGAGGGISHAQEVAKKSGSGNEFERLKKKLTPYGDRAKKGLKTFQANAEDILTQYKDKLSQQVKDKYKDAKKSTKQTASFVSGQVGKTIKHYTRKSKKTSTKKKDMIGKRWNKFDVAMQDFMYAHGSKYKKYF